MPSLVRVYSSISLERTLANGGRRHARPVRRPPRQAAVSDLHRSREWYTSVLGLRVEIEFVEDGELMGLALEGAAGRLRLPLRLDPVRVSALSGFDPLALEVPSGRTSTPGVIFWTTSARRMAASSPATRAGRSWSGRTTRTASRSGSTPTERNCHDRHPHHPDQDADRRR